MKVVQLCPTLCDPMDYTVHEILQAGILEWVAFPSPGDLPDQGIEPGPPALQVDSLQTELWGSPIRKANTVNFFISFSLSRKARGSTVNPCPGTEDPLASQAGLWWRFSGEVSSPHNFHHRSALGACVLSCALQDCVNRRHTPVCKGWPWTPCRVLATLKSG